MKRLAAAFFATLIAAPALAQATPPAAPTPPSPPASAADIQTTPAQPRDPARPGRGASIKMQGPGGSEIAVRCADGETTRACAEVVLQLVERTRSGGSERRRDWDRDRDTRGGEMRGGSRGGDYRSDNDRDRE